LVQREQFGEFGSGHSGVAEMGGSQDGGRGGHQSVTHTRYGIVTMQRFHPRSAGRLLRGIGSAALWGAIEFVALARSRWMARLHAGR
jgi:hypothetical protein